MSRRFGCRNDLTGEILPEIFNQAELMTQKTNFLEVPIKNTVTQAEPG
jgi:hypothetical protein